MKKVVKFLKTTRTSESSNSKPNFGVKLNLGIFREYLLCCLSLCFKCFQVESTENGISWESADFADFMDFVNLIDLWEISDLLLIQVGKPNESTVYKFHQSKYIGFGSGVNNVSYNNGRKI